MTNQSNSETCCPFWDKYGKRTCLNVASGLFIPTQEHILHFCENELYITCVHYTAKHPTEQSEPPSDRQEKLIKNRRIYTRIPVSQNLSVSRFSMAKNEEEGILDDQATVMDLSLGGMRIETSARLYENQIVSFIFDENFHPPGFKGKGEIKWQDTPEPEEGVPGRAGLAFVDDQTKDTVRNHLLGMGEKLLYL